MNTHTFMMSAHPALEISSSSTAIAFPTTATSLSPRTTHRRRVPRPEPELGRSRSVRGFGESTGRNIALSDSLDPASANYLTFAVPGPVGQCVTDSRTMTGNGALFGIFTYLWQGLLGPTSVTCGGNKFDAVVTADDFMQWRMVTFRAPNPGEKPTDFFDILTLRTANEIVMREPRVGFFTTPAFFANWATNTNNQARVTANQALIVALGQSINPSTSVAPLDNTDIDAVHADPSTSCYGCHRTLDPMRDYFRNSYTIGFARQIDPALTSTGGSFAFGGVTNPGPGIEDLANALASHPLFASAWAQKLCYYANSAGCADSDPEFLRIVQAFQGSTFDFRVLMRELFSSPLVTGATPTATWTAQGETVSITRYDHFCTELTNRIGISKDVCSLQPEVATNLPTDGFSRGSEVPVEVSDPSLFYRAASEVLCSAIANGPYFQGGKYNGMSASAAIANFVSIVMGLGSSDPATAGIAQILSGHLATAKMAGASDNDALKSTFVLACTSAATTSIGL